MSSSPDPTRLGRELAVRHGGGSDEGQVVDGIDESLTLLQVAESPRAGDWTLRSALVRFAQVQPELSGALLESVRRSQAALDPLSRNLMRHGAVTDRGLSIASDGGLAPIADPLPDIRSADIARAVRACGDTESALDAVVEAYGAEAAGDLDPAEREAIPLLMVMLDLDELAEVLVEWARTRAPEEPPIEEANRLGRRAFERLGALGVARETGGRPPGRRPTDTGRS